MPRVRDGRVWTPAISSSAGGGSWGRGAIRNRRQLRTLRFALAECPLMADSGRSAGLPELEFRPAPSRFTI